MSRASQQRVASLIPLSQTDFTGQKVGTIINETDRPQRRQQTTITNQPTNQPIRTPFWPERSGSMIASFQLVPNVTDPLELVQRGFLGTPKRPPVDCLATISSNPPKLRESTNPPKKGARDSDL